MIDVFIDGLCKPNNNTGTATFGYLIKRSGELIFKDYGVIGKGKGMTNNVAEYTALIHALEKIRERKLDDEEVCVKSDSRLVVHQMKGEWKVKAPLVVPLFKQARELAKGMKISFNWIPREENKEADELARKAYASIN